MNLLKILFVSNPFYLTKFQNITLNQCSELFFIITVRMYVRLGCYAHTCKIQRILLNIFLFLSLPYSLKTGFLINQGEPISFSGYLARELYLPPNTGITRHTHPCSAFYVDTANRKCYYPPFCLLIYLKYVLLHLNEFIFHLEINM